MSNYLEREINLLISKINEMNIGLGWKNNPTRLFDGTYVEGEKFDYTILTRYKMACFDAKETIKTVWNIANKDIKQAKNLELCSKSGVWCFFLIYFSTTKSLLYIDIKDFTKILVGEGRKHIKPEDCKPFDYKLFIQPRRRKK